MPEQDLTELDIEKCLDVVCNRKLRVPLDYVRFLGTQLHKHDRDGVLIHDRIINAWLRIRTKSGQLTPITLNPAQQQLSRRWGARNIVLKARQLGITTYVAARFFVQTVTQPGTLTVQVAHDQDAAEEIFFIVHRFLENLPNGVRRELRTSRSNVRQIVFPRIEAIASKDICDEQKFTAGLGKIIDGVVECLNASVWAKAK